MDLTVEQLLKEKKDFLELNLLTENGQLGRIIPNNEIHRPGLALAGFTRRFAHKRTQVLGETELAFLADKSAAERKHIIESLMEFEIPCIVVTKGIDPPLELIEIANLKGVPVLQTYLTTTDFISRLSAYLDSHFSPSVTIHGTLVDVYGVGLLYTGKSGIGKSECALDLVERGHRLVADDMVKLSRRAPEVVVGSGSELLGHHMEIRGVGIIDVEKLFGIRCIRLQKRVEVEVRLVPWEEAEEYERLGIEDKFTRILGVEIPVVVVPLSPGKNITVISEVIAMNHMLKVYGHNPAQEFSRRLSEELTRRSLTAEYLESDYE